MPIIGSNPNAFSRWLDKENMVTSYNEKFSHKKKKERQEENESSSQRQTWENLKLLSERSQSYKGMCPMIPIPWDSGKGKTMVTVKKTGHKRLRGAGVAQVFCSNVHVSENTMRVYFWGYKWILAIRQFHKYAYWK